jgi:chemotaxis protein methyltransferase CheR
MLEAGAGSLEEFYESLAGNRNPDMRRRVIDAITTNETLWFRDETPWKYMREVLLPRFAEELASGGRSKVRIWSAAASTGQEIYSTVMCVHDFLTTSGRRPPDLSPYEFFATDISTRALDIAKKGRYDRISIRRGLDEYHKLKYFTQSGNAWDIAPFVKDAVTFAPLNLKDSFAALGPFDIIFCRYVLIYFSDELKQKIITGIRNLLTSGGVLFTGSYVFYDLFQDSFVPCHYDNMTYYTPKPERGKE